MSKGLPEGSSFFFAPAVGLGDTNLMKALNYMPSQPRPLAEILRPQTLDEVVGQDALLSPAGQLGLMLAQGALGSIIFWNPMTGSCLSLTWARI